MCQWHGAGVHRMRDLALAFCVTFQVVCGIADSLSSSYPAPDLVARLLTSKGF